MDLLSAAFVTLLLSQSPSAPAPAVAQSRVPAAKTPGVRGAGLSLQVALDRAGFSPGTLDGSVGASTKKALDAYRKANDGDPAPSEPTTRYLITDTDAAGPFEPDMPKEMPDKAKLPALSYETLIEALAERYHSTPAFLRRLNPGAQFAAGEEITVPNIEPMVIPASASPKAAKPEPKAASGRGGAGAADAAPPKADVIVTVAKSASALTVTDASGKTLMYAPVTTGSEHDPLPIGDWKVNGVSLNPPFRYNPDLFWDADPTHDKALLKPGPNNPVGLVWIDLSKEHYGIHGTPEPSTIGKTASHGCVRLTNWDALKLAALVKPGTKVVFKP
ncbi:MAG: L,D-transpeptidase [Vicinamibacterales bacterium]